MSERFPERRSPEGNERLRQKEKAEHLPPESESDLQLKEAFSNCLEGMKEGMKQEMDAMRKMVHDLREREMSFSNFVSPENWLGLSTYVRGDKNTFSGERLDTIEAMLELRNLRYMGLIRMNGLIGSGARWENIKKDPMVQHFMNSPEGQLLNSVLTTTKDQATLEAEFKLAKARELRGGIIRGDELAQSWYDSLKGTPLEQVAEKEKMTLGDRTLRKGREFANSMLGLDSLTMMVAGAGIGRAAGYLVSNSDKLRNMSMIANTALNESNLATRLVVPGVNVIKSKAGETGLRMFLKGSGNFFAEAFKGLAYTELARAAGGEKAAHAISYPLMFLPGLKGQFEATMNMKLAENPENFKKFAEWVVQKYKTPEMLEQAMGAGLKEAYNRSKSSVGIEEARQLYAEIRTSSRTLFEHFTKKAKEVRKTPAQSTGTRSGIAENLGAAEGQNMKPRTLSNGPTNQEVTTGPEKEVPPSIGAVQENTKARVGEVMKTEPELQELLDAGLPKDYVLALQELGVSNKEIMKFKGWGKETLHREIHVRTELAEFNRKAAENNQPLMTLEEAHTIYGSTTNLFFERLNSKLWNDSGEDLKLTELLRSGASKMPKAAPIQYRGDKMVLDDVLRQNGLLEKFEAGETLSPESLRKLIGTKLKLKAFSSSSDNVGDSFWDSPKTKYQIEIQNSDAHDITPFALFPNFGNELKKVGGVRTNQESVFLPGSEIRILDVAQGTKIDGKPVLRILVRRE